MFPAKRRQFLTAKSAVPTLAPVLSLQGTEREKERKQFGRHHRRRQQNGRHFKLHMFKLYTYVSRKSIYLPYPLVLCAKYCTQSQNMYGSRYYMVIFKIGVYGNTFKKPTPYVIMMR